jgi:hypothetical protein
MKKCLFISAILIVAALSACGNGVPKNQTSQINSIDSVSTKNYIEVLYFHNKQRCVTCRAIETLTKEVLETDFAEKLKNRTIAFKVIDISQKENEAITEKYEVSFSSLILNKGGKVVNLTDMGFRYAKGSPERFKTLLKDELNTLMK